LKLSPTTTLTASVYSGTGSLFLYVFSLPAFHSLTNSTRLSGVTSLNGYLNLAGGLPPGKTILTVGVSPLETPTYSNNLLPVSSLVAIAKYIPSNFLAT